MIELITASRCVSVLLVDPTTDRVSPIPPFSRVLPTTLPSLPCCPLSVGMELVTMDNPLEHDDYESVGTESCGGG